GGEPGSGELAQLVVDEREQLGRGPGIAPRGRVEELRDVGHAAEHTSAGSEPRPETGRRPSPYRPPASSHSAPTVGRGNPTDPGASTPRMVRFAPRTGRVKTRANAGVRSVFGGLPGPGDDRRGGGVETSPRERTTRQR